MKELLNHILTEKEDIFKPITKEEIPSRRRDFLYTKFDEVKIIKNQDGTVDIDGSLNLSDMGLTSLLELPYKIKRIIGNFNCKFNELTTLKGAPEFVGGYFSCSGNQLTTLEGAPEQVGKYFICSYNKLTSLKGAPESVGGSFYCTANKLTTLEGAPRQVGGDFHCKHNKLYGDEEIPGGVRGEIYG